MRIYTIYKATNTINGKSYIGFDSNWPSRQGVHKSSSNKSTFHFHRALKKYGFDNFSWEVLYQSDDKDHTLKTMESYFIRLYNTFLGEGYNMTFGGEGFTGNHSEETRRKLSLSRQNMSPETRQKMSIAKKGKTHSPETRQKLSIAHKGKTFSPETRQKLSLARQNISPETRQKMSIVKKGKTHSPETRLKMSLSQQARYNKARQEEN